MISRYAFMIIVILVTIFMWIIMGEVNVAVGEIKRDIQCIHEILREMK